MLKYLLKKGIITKPYFFPPLHLQKTYSKYKNKYHTKLPVTNEIGENILSLPMYSHITKKEIDLIIKVIKEYN